MNSRFLVIASFVLFSASFAFANGLTCNESAGGWQEMELPEFGLSVWPQQFENKLTEYDAKIEFEASEKNSVLETYSGRVFRQYNAGLDIEGTDGVRSFNNNFGKIKRVIVRKVTPEITLEQSSDQFKLALGSRSPEQFIEFEFLNRNTLSTRLSRSLLGNKLVDALVNTFTGNDYTHYRLKLSELSEQKVLVNFSLPYQTKKLTLLGRIDAVVDSKHIRFQDFATGQFHVLDLTLMNDGIFSQNLSTASWEQQTIRADEYFKKAFLNNRILSELDVENYLRDHRFLRTSSKITEVWAGSSNIHLSMNSTLNKSDLFDSKNAFAKNHFAVAVVSNYRTGAIRYISGVIRDTGWNHFSIVDAFGVEHSINPGSCDIHFQLVNLWVK